MQSKKEKFLQWAFIFLALPVLASSSSSGMADRGDPSLLTLERLFSSNEFAVERFGPPKWMKSSTGYTVLQPSKEVGGARDIVLYNPENDQTRILVPCSRLVPAGETSPLKIDDYIWSPDEKKLLIFTSPKRVFHKNFGDYWFLNTKDWNLRKLGGNFESSSLLNATFSPDGGKVAFVHENNIFVEDVDSDRIVQLTMDGSENILNGTFDYVYEEEFFTTHGFRWSPDSKSIAYWQLNTENVPTFYLINNTDSLYPSLIPFKFSKPGQPNSACRIGAVSANGGKTLWFDVPGDSSNNYIQELNWAANSEEVVFQHLNRLQNRNELMLGNARTGSVRAIMADSDPAWVHVVTDLHWLSDGKYFTWVSEKDGWRHVYIVSRSGDEMKLITPGEFDVESILRIDEKGGWLYFIASPDNPTQRYLYRVPLDGSGNAQRLSPKELPGTHSYQISPDAKWAFHTYSNFETPPVTGLTSLPGHNIVRTLSDNSKLLEKVKSLRRGKAEFFRVDIGEGVLLDAWSMTPPDFNPKKKYPLLFYIYGEPWGSTVTDNWGGSRYLWHLMLTQQGYIVMSIDNRGTRVPRGRAWRKIIYRQVGILASADQAAAARAIIKRWSYIDPERIGIWGASGGGAMTLNCLFRYPDLYRTGVALAAPANQLYYNSIYQERYMGLPKDNPEGYEKGSPLNFAHQLEGNLLYIHGTGDDNVHYQNAEALVNELIKHNKTFTIMAYPNRSHGISEGANTNRHKYELITHYLKVNLPPGPR